MKTKIKISEGERIALGELRSMLPFALVCNGLVLVISGLAGFIEVNLNFGIFTGLLFGNIVSAANFYAIGFASGVLLRRGKESGGRSFAGVAYGLRYFGMFALYWILASFELINLFTALIPLLYPSFYYKFKAIFNKSV
ncbi:MAG: hypothetical protein LBC86_04810 [Oscillospiraceae bacterium]|jgi:hypothetical protein|nr:hypothetical protein [Oscillospiraceae bacterium]